MVAGRRKPGDAGERRAGGDGEVDFPAVFKRLGEAHFSGPMLVETLGPGEPASESRRAYDFLVGLLR